MAAPTPAVNEDTPSTLNAQAIAEAVRVALWKDDHASQALGMQVTAISPTTATLTMSVRRDMLNGHGSCHGGMIATLADSAFAFACNACNEQTVASGFQLSIVAPAHEGDVLTAHCVEQHRSGRTGVFDCEVRNQHGARIALFRGQSHALKGRPVVPELPLPPARQRSAQGPAGDTRP